MIITRTPLRLSLGGGATDLPSYYQRFGGFVISAAIDKYVYININRTFLSGYLLKYSELEVADSLDQIRHPLIREALRMNQIAPPIEIVSVADVAAGTGLGSSGSFLVGLTHALHAYRRQSVTAAELAREAFEIEVERLGMPVGKQDHYIAAYGGVTCQEYQPDGSVIVTPLRMEETALLELRDSLMLFFVGYTRRSSELLQDQVHRSEQGDESMFESLHFSKRLGVEIKTMLEDGDIERFGELLHEHWMHKRLRSDGMTNQRIDELYGLARTRGGATGGKLVGAGGGGFLLLHTGDRRRLRNVMTGAGARELDFRFDFAGSVVLLRDP